MRLAIRRVVLVAGAVVVGAVIWEAWRVLTDANPQKMPALADIWSRMWEPQQRGRDQTVFMAVVESGWYTFRESLAGFLVGSIVGMALAVVMLRARILEFAILPYVIASQTIPLIALAPVIVSWGNRSDWEPWMSVSLIAAYLTFFPVAVNGLRGLKSPDAESLELMNSYAASWWKTLVKLRLPASVPYLIPALKLAATASIVGAIVGEISTGVEGGIGRLLISYMQQGSTDPPKLYAAILGAAALGLVFVGLIGLFDRLVPGHRPVEET